VTHSDNPAVFNLSNQLTFTEPWSSFICYLAGPVQWSQWIASSLQ